MSAFSPSVSQSHSSGQSPFWLINWLEMPARGLTAQSALSQGLLSHRSLAFLDFYLAYRETAAGIKLLHFTQCPLNRTICYIYDICLGQYWRFYCVCDTEFCDRLWNFPHKPLSVSLSYFKPLLKTDALAKHLITCPNAFSLCQILFCWCSGEKHQDIFLC